MDTVRAALGWLSWVGISLVAGWVGSRFPSRELYETLKKPAWALRGLVFRPVWTLLYTLMGTAARRYESGGVRGSTGCLVPLPPLSSR